MSANLRGTITPNGYVPPSNVTVTWRRPGAPDITHPLNRSIPWTDDQSFRLRYGAGDPETIGRQITAIGSEQLGGRAWLILKELYAQAGIDRTPKQIGQDTWDFAITEIGSRPADWCDYKRMTGKPDPICGGNCPACGGRDTGRVVNAGEPVVPPTNLKLDSTGKTLTFDWAGEGAVTFTLYRKDAADTDNPNAPFILLGTSKQSPINLKDRPADGSLLLLYATQRKRVAAEAQYKVGGGSAIEPAEPPVDKPAGAVVTLEGEIKLTVNGIARTFKIVES